MRDLIWESDAVDQLDQIADFISLSRPEAATRLVGTIHEALERVRRFPEASRPGRITGTRELIVHPNYIVVYRTTDTTIDVLRILHARRRYP